MRSGNEAERDELLRVRLLTLAETWDEEARGMKADPMPTVQATGLAVESCARQLRRVLGDGSASAEPE